MVTKSELIRKFQKEPERYWKVSLFDELGFERRKCEKCGKYFWTLTDQTTCNDSSCRNYDFIQNPPTSKSFDFFEAWEVIRKFFEERGHVYLHRYPTLCTWYPLYFTIAGIVNFYRVDDKGNLDFEFPANPSILLQPCLRFNDIENVGINGRSFTCFGMIQQSSLYDGETGYWKDECIQLDFELLTKVFGIDPKEIVFIEDAWIGYGAFGTSLEYHVRGLELGNAVFTEFAGSPENFRLMKQKVIDMGAGHERFVWISQGTPTAYDAVFPEVVKRIKEKCGVEFDKEIFIEYCKVAGGINVEDYPDLKKVKGDISRVLNVDLERVEELISKMQAVYSLADHSRALAFSIADGGIPSNIAGGYNLRVILRRALDFIRKFGWEIKLLDVINWQIDFFKKMYPELDEDRERIEEIIKVEEDRYKKTKERIAKRIVEIKKEELTEEKLIELYESEGITPEDLGIEVPSDFFLKLTERHMKEKIKKEEVSVDVSDVKPTEILYYKPIYTFEAKIIKIVDDWVILDRTAFYPKSGGQDCDLGRIEDVEVKEVRKIGDVIIHKVENVEKLREGMNVKCEIDEERRKILTLHHDAIHIINAAARMVLGKHVHQYGAEKTVEKARIDLTHFRSLSEEEKSRIEKIANEIVKKSVPIRKYFMKRGEAEQKFGLGIYAGGRISPKELRIVEIEGYDVEACGGTHGDNTGDVKIIKIERVKRIADGLIRIEIKAGDVAKRDLEEKARILQEVSEILQVSEEDVPKAVEEMFKKWKKLRKELRRRK